MFKKLLLFVTLALFASNLWAKDPDLKNENSKVSYIIGFQMGSNLKRQSIDLDLAALTAGLEDGTQNGKPKLDEEMMRKVMDAFREKMMAKQKAQQETMGKANIEKGNKWLEANKKNKG